MYVHTFVSVCVCTHIHIFIHTYIGPALSERAAAFKAGQSSQTSPVSTTVNPLNEIMGGLSLQVCTFVHMHVSVCMCVCMSPVGSP
jgi:hypothetical protein